MTRPRGDAPPPDLSVVVLCHQAAAVAPRIVPPLAADLEAAGVAHEIILVANTLPGAPPDPTPAVLRALAAQNPRIRVVSLPKQGGMSWDMRTGLEAARGDALAVVDGDGQIPLSDVLRTYRVFRETGADIAKTRRLSREDGPLRRAISCLYNAAFRLLWPSAPFRDVNAKPKILSRAAYSRLRLRSTEWFIDAEIMIQALALGLRVAEIPATAFHRKDRPSRLSLRTLFSFLAALLRYRFFPPR